MIRIVANPNTSKETRDHPDRSESEMGRMLDERIRQDEAGRKKINRVISRVLIVTAALLIIGFFSSSSNRRALSAVIGELRNTPAKQPADAPSTDSSQSPEQAQQPGPNGAANPPAGPISPEDMHFAGELMRFIQPPTAHPPPAPAPAEGAKH